MPPSKDMRYVWGGGRWEEVRIPISGSTKTGIVSWYYHSSRYRIEDSRRGEKAGNGGLPPLLLFRLTPPLLWPRNEEKDKE